MEQTTTTTLEREAQAPRRKPRHRERRPTSHWDFAKLVQSSVSGPDAPGYEPGERTR